MEEYYRQLAKLPVSQNEIINPLCIILVKNGSKGDRLLFRYPFKGSNTSTMPSPNSIKDKDRPRVVIEASPPSPPAENQAFSTRRATYDGVSRPTALFRRGELLNNRATPPEPTRIRNPYAIRKDTEDELNGFGGEVNGPAPGKPTISMDLSEKDLSNLLAVNNELSERKFELKVKDVRFVGHPTLMQHPSILRPINTQVPATSTKIFHIAFCLNAMASHSIVKCFYDLSKRLGIALRHEEYRCGYLSQEMKIIIGLLDQACQEHEDEEEVGSDINCFQHASPKILQNSTLARLLKSIYDDVCASGFIQLRVNNWIQLSFCLPQKIHVIPFRTGVELVEPERIHRCLESIRPYHAILLLVDREELSSSFLVDSSGSIVRVLQVYSPLKSLQATAADADLSLSQVVEIASHLVYWAMATLIYPMCETNVYVIAPDAPIVSSQMEEAFLNCFPGISLSQTMADFSLPIPLGERVNPVLGGSYLQAQLVQLVCWLLQYRLLIQLHTYLYLLPALHENGVHNSIPDGQFLFQNEVRPYEPNDGEDENTVSDSYSETAPEEVSTPTDALLGIGAASVSAAAAAIQDQPNQDVRKNDRVEPNGGDSVDAGPPSKLEAPEATMEETMRNLSVNGRRAVEIVKQDLTLPDIKLFARLSKYFTGEFHFEEIMYRENVRRSQLLLLVDKFRQVLVISEREDPAINFFKLDHW